MRGAAVPWEAACEEERRERRLTWLDDPDVRAVMTLPRAERERLMEHASRSRAPLACVSRCRSEPARSTRLSCERRYLHHICTYACARHGARHGAPKLWKGRARSTEAELWERRYVLSPSASETSVATISRVKTRCDLDEAAFIAVAPTARCAEPACEGGGGEDRGTRREQATC